MRVVWSKRARSNLAEIVRFIKRDDEQAARRVFERIWTEVGELSSCKIVGASMHLQDAENSSFHPGHTL